MNQRRDARRNRAKIVVAAGEVFRENGGLVPLEQVARRAGVDRGTLYRHFPDRGTLHRRFPTNPYAPDDWPVDTALAVVSRARLMSDSRAVEPLTLLERKHVLPAVREAAAAALKSIGGGTRTET